MTGVQTCALPISGHSSQRQRGGLARIDFANMDNAVSGDTSISAIAMQPLWLDDAGNVWGCGNGIAGNLHTKYLYLSTSPNGESFSQLLAQKVAKTGYYFVASIRAFVVIPGTSQQKILAMTCSLLGSTGTEDGRLWYSTDGAASTTACTEIANPYLGATPFFIKGVSNSWNVACTADGSKVYLGTYGYRMAQTHRDVYVWDTATATASVIFHLDAADADSASHIHGVHLDPDGGVWIMVGENGGAHQGVWHSQAAPSTVSVLLGLTDTGSFSLVYSGSQVKPMLGLQRTDGDDRYMYVTEDWLPGATITRIHYHDAGGFKAPYTTSTVADYTGLSGSPLTSFVKLSALTWVGYGYESTVPYMVVSHDGGETWAYTSLSGYEGAGSLGSMIAAEGTYPTIDGGMPLGALNYPGYIPPYMLRPEHRIL